MGGPNFNPEDFKEEKREEKVPVLEKKVEPEVQEKKKLTETKKEDN